MTWVAVAVGGAALASGGLQAGMSWLSAGKQEDAMNAMIARQNKYADEIAGYSTDYVDFLTKLDEDFDPYDVEDAFNSLYEAVIQPMERDFDENVLPGIQAAYSGGIMGQGAGLSGAQASAESSARRDLTEKSADLRYQERNRAIGQNYADFERRANLAGAKYSAQTAAPLTRLGLSQQQYSAQTDTIAAKLASGNALVAGANNALNVGMSAYNAQQSQQTTNNLIDAMNNRNQQPTGGE